MLATSVARRAIGHLGKLFILARSQTKWMEFTWTRVPRSWVYSWLRSKRWHALTVAMCSCPNETLTECFHCGVRGHWASKCPKKGMAKASGAEAKGGGGKPSSSEEGDARVFLPYLPENVSEDMLRSHFGRFGKIVDIFIPHVKSGKEKRIAFITYLTHGEAMACTKNPKHIINNKTCEVVKASPKPGGGKPEAAGAAGAKGGHGGGAKAKGRK